MMRRAIRVPVILAAAGLVAVLGSGCRNGEKAEHPEEDHPQAEHPEGEEPEAEHPDEEHPEDEGGTR